MRLILNEVLEPRLRKAIEKEARAEDVSLNDAVGKILAERFSTEWPEPTSRYRPNADRFKLRVPDDLLYWIRTEAIERDATARGIVLETLMNHYRLGEFDPRRRPRTTV